MTKLYRIVSLAFSICLSAISIQAQTLLHYWNFNNSTTQVDLLTVTSSIVATPSITHVAGGISAIQITSNTLQGFDVTNPNARNSDLSGTHLRFNDPIGGALLLALPTTGYKDIVVKYATRRSGSGAGTQVVEYSSDGTNFSFFGNVIPVDGNPTLATLDFSALPETDNNPNFKVRITFQQGSGGLVGNNRFDNLTLEGSAMPPLSLMHYWNFNNSIDETSLLAVSTTVGGGTLTRINGATSVIQITSNTGNGFDVLNENARNSDAAGTHLRYNNSVDGTLIFELPTTGYQDVVAKYTTRRSSVANGAATQVIDYSTDGTSYSNLTSITTDPANPVLQTLDFSSIPAADNNPNFKIKITFLQGAGGITGNNRFDNFTLDGYSLGGDTNPPSVAFSPANNAVDVAASVLPTITFNEAVRLVDDTPLDNSNVDNVVELKLSNSGGAPVPFDATINGTIVTITPSSSLLSNQVYYLAVKANVVEDQSNNAITSVQSASFTTIPPQTAFQPGDLIFVAYRTNASTTDEVAFLTLVDILGGTQINFTDAKYTDNAQPQCPGGFTWRAPVGGIVRGTVVSIVVDASPVTTSHGTVTGGGFGLSSGGEQVIVYTGTAATASHITAMSTNAWILSNTTCGGSLSKIPAGLTDGQTSINLSTAPGNVAGVTVNAYYNGTQSGTTAEVRAAVLNPANWIGVGAGTPAQTWPAWGFFTPTVVAATVLTQTTIKLDFNKALDNASATNPLNYSGVAGLQTVTLSGDAKSVTLVYTPFAPGSSNTLTVSGIIDTEAIAMAGPYVLNFTYSTEISFDKKFVLVQEDAGNVSVKIKLLNPSTSQVDLVLKGSPFSNASAGDLTYVTQTLNFTGTSPLEHIIQIPINNDSEAEQDEYFVLSLENVSGASITGGNLMTIYIKDNDRLAPVPTKDIELSYVSSYDPGSSTAEIVAHDPTSQRLFIASSIQDRLDIASFANPAAIAPITSVSMTSYGGITSVAVRNGIVAVASPNANDQLNGSVVFFDTNGVFQKQVTVGVLPDMITFTPDGTKVMTANEGQPNDAYTSDPEGSVSIIDISGGIATLDQTKVTTLEFTAFNSQEANLLAAGIRKLKLSSTLSQDFEPEYISVSSDSHKAWVTLQENNAIAEINLDTKTFTSVWPLGKKDLSVFGNGIDASDNSGIVTIANWPVKSFYLPDAVAGYSVGSTQYLVTANEGDEKEYAGLNERTTVGAVTLDPTVFPHAAFLKENHNLGRLRMSNLSGDTDSDGDYDEINIPGGRSFSIWNATTQTKVFDSGDEIERFTSSDPSISALFNADNGNNSFKSRSRAKGPEPEGLTVVTLEGKTYAFVALERVGGVMVYDITDPAAVKFVDYKNSRSLANYSGDHGPEGIIYISRENSPTAKAYIAVANEISGTVSVYEVLKAPKLAQTITFNALANKTAGDAEFALTAAASSGLAVVFSTADNEATISGSNVTLVKAGRVTIKANQGGNDNFNAATEVTQAFCINPAIPVITLTGVNTASPVLQSTATAGNQWYKDGVAITAATAPTLPVTSPGIYTVKSTIETCESALSIEFPVIVTGDLNSGLGTIKHYPNPVSRQLQVEVPGQGQKLIKIYQMNGSTQEFRQTEKEHEIFEVEGWSSGYYILHIQSENGNYFGKFFKK